MDLTIKKIRNDLPTHKTKKYPKRDLSKISHIDIHHSASPQENYRGIETIKGFARFHVNGHGWPGIGYHYVIDPDGVIYKTGDDGESRWSVGGNNSYTISIMMIGRLDTEKPTDKQYAAALGLAKVVSDAYSVPVKNVKGHKEYPGHSSNTCPSIDMDDFRNDLKKTA